MKIDIETALKALGCAILILAGFGKAAAALVGFEGGTGILGSLCLGVGIYLAAPIVAGVIKPPATGPKV